MQTSGYIFFILFWFVYKSNGTLIVAGWEWNSWVGLCWGCNVLKTSNHEVMAYWYVYECTWLTGKFVMCVYPKKIWGKEFVSVACKWIWLVALQLKLYQRSFMKGPLGIKMCFNIFFFFSRSQIFLCQDEHHEYFCPWLLWGCSKGGHQWILQCCYALSWGNIFISFTVTSVHDWLRSSNRMQWWYSDQWFYLSYM